MRHLNPVTLPKCSDSASPGFVCYMKSAWSEFVYMFGIEYSLYRSKCLAGSDE